MNGADDLAADGHLSEKPERRYQGLGVSPGLARGPVFVLRRNDESLPDYTVRPEEVPGEIARFEAALVSTRVQIL